MRNLLERGLAIIKDQQQVILWLMYLRIEAGCGTPDTFKSVSLCRTEYEAAQRAV